VDSVSERGSRQVFGTIISAAARSATMTHTVATRGCDETAQPTMPIPATTTRAMSPRLSPPSPRRIESTNTMTTPTVWTPTMTRLQPAPSAHCEANAMAPRRPQMNQLPRCGRVAPVNTSRM
jgi:hypothetical protein